jgi:uncharacterized protein involved in tolerance to divalent cations
MAAAATTAKLISSYYLWKGNVAEAKQLLLKNCKRLPELDVFE